MKSLGILALCWVTMIGRLPARPPLYFTANRGQWQCSADFRAKIPGGHVDLHAKGFNYFFLDQDQMLALHEHGGHSFEEANAARLSDQHVSGRWVSVSFVGGRDAEAQPLGELSFKHHYFKGSDPSAWQANVENYESLHYPSIYEGIDMKVFAYGSHLKYDLHVAPAADVTQIRLHYEGMTKMFLRDGNLYVDGEFVQIIEQQPVAFQWINGEKRWINCEYRLQHNMLTFVFPDGYDPCYGLVIDPILIFATYSGSTADNWGSTATPGEHGTVYSAGVTNEATFGGEYPATPGTFQVNYGGLYDVGILKYDSLGEQLLYASFLGGELSESPHSLIVNASNELVVLGTTSSSQFPTTPDAHDRSYNGGTSEVNVIEYSNGSDIFVARISADGSQLLASTYLGGAANDGMNPSFSPLTANYGDQLRGDVIIDSVGNIIISSVTSSDDFPVQNSFDLTYNDGLTDAVIVKLNPELSAISWATFFGGVGSDASHTIKLDSNGDIYIGGGTSSNDLPSTLGVHQKGFGGEVDGWIAKLSADGSSLLTATYTGTDTFNQIYFIDLNSNNEVYAYGQTEGSNFPYTEGAYRNFNSGQFLQKFSSDLQTLLVSTVFGSGRGIPDISPTAFLVNDCNNIYMTGWGGVVNQATGHWPNNTVGMPISSDAFQASTSGSDFYFIVLTDDASEFLYGTYLGGNTSRTHVDGGTSRFDKHGIVYHAVCAGCQAFNAAGTSSSDFPSTAGAWSNTNNSPNCNNAAFKFDLSSLRARIQTNSVDLTHPGLHLVCFPDTVVFQNRSTGGEVYEWDFGDGTGQVTSDTAALLHRFPGEGEYTIKLKAIDEGTCVGKDSTFVKVNVQIPTGFAGADRNICFGELTQLPAGGGTNYLWVSEDDSVTFNTAQPVVSPEDTLSYYVAVTDGNGCVVRDTVTVNVVPRIDLKFSYERISECIGRTSLKVTNLTEPSGDSLYFDFGDGTISGLPEVSHTYDADGDYTIRLVGVRESCVFDQSVTLPFYYLEVPNVITPGLKDGRNDTFKIQYGDQLLSEAAIPAELQVYNRWGLLIYDDKHYIDNWPSADVAAGTYYYKLKIHEDVVCKGWLQVVK